MNNFIKENWFKLLAAVLLFWALTNNTYDYYQLLRWAILIIGGCSAYFAYKNEEKGWTWIFSIMAILFNPIIPFYLTKSAWQTLDLITGFVFLISVFKTKTNEK
jgi:FtsH-binding integral membrane protein